MATVKIFEVMSDKFNVVEIYSTENYAQKYIIKFYNYEYTDLAGLTVWSKPFQGNHKISLELPVLSLW
jgi:hypothetical protein